MGEENRRCDAAEMEMETEEEGTRVAEWEAGLPDADDLMPLSQLLIPPELATAFSVSPEPRRTVAEVNRASHHTLSSLRRTAAVPFPSDEDANLAAADDADNAENADDADADDEELEDDDNPAAGGGGGGSESRKTRREDSATTTDDAESGSAGGDGARAVKRPRLVWTPHLHKRFADVVTHLGIKKAVPKTIMQLMNVEGLTRENVASHLQKYRLYLKRQGLPYDGPSTSENGADAPPLPVPVPMQYGPPLLPMPSLPIPAMNHHYHGFQSHPFGSMVSYPHTARREK